MPIHLSTSFRQVLYLQGSLLCSPALSFVVFVSGQETAGKVSLKHIYEIASIKCQDPTFENISLQEVCKRVIGTAHSIGVEVVQHLEAIDYAQFLKERQEIVEQQQEELEELRQSKMLRL